MIEELFIIAVPLIIIAIVLIIVIPKSRKKPINNELTQNKTTDNEDIKNQEIYNAVYKDFSECGYFKSELLPQLLEKLKDIILYKKSYFSDLFSYDDCLTLEEKKKYGYPTRQKISREMINSFSDIGLKLENPKETINDLYEINSSTIYKKYKIIEMKQELTYNDNLLGYRIIACLDSGTCIICGSLDGTIIKNSTDIDYFEKHKCLNKYCRCEIIDVQKGMGGSDGITYAGWLRKQSAGVKKEILGNYYEQYKSGKSLKEIVKLIEVVS
jgi:hypothetical protein